MYNYKLTVDGMYCSMCESHVNDVIRNNFSVKKVKSNHKKNETLITSNEELDETKLEDVLHNIGYEVTTITKE